MIHPLHLDIPADTAFLATLRSLSSAWLGSASLFEGDWPLIITELATNAIEAAPADGSVSVDFVLASDLLRLTVTDDGSGFDLDDVRRNRHQGPGGRGLRIVEALTSSLFNEHRDGRHRVVCSAPPIWLADDAEGERLAGQRR